MSLSFFEKTSIPFDDFSISTICLAFSKDNIDKCRHWIQYKGGKIDQLSRNEIIELLESHQLPLPQHYKNEIEETNDTNDTNEENQKNKYICIIS